MWISSQVHHLLEPIRKLLLNLSLTKNILAQAHNLINFQ